MSEIDINKRIDWNEIDSNISKDYDYINNMLELVPPQHYFPQETDMNKLDNRWMRRKKTKKEIEKDKKIKKKMKYDKLDPDSYKSVPQLLQEKGGYESDEENSSEENGENGENEEKPERKIIPGFSSTGLKDRDELKKRLIEKIDSLKKKRKARDQIDEDRPTKRQRTNNNKKKIRNQRSSPHKILKLRKMDMNIRMAKKAMVKMMWMKTLNLEHLISVQKFLSQLTYLIRKKAKKKRFYLKRLWRNKGYLKN